MRTEQPTQRTPRMEPVTSIHEVSPGGRKLVEIEGRSIGLFDVNGTYVAVLNGCADESAVPLYS